MARPKALPEIDPERCTGCGRCVAACEPKVLWLETDGPNGWGRKRAVLHDLETRFRKAIAIKGDANFTVDQVQFTCTDHRGRLIAMT